MFLFLPSVALCNSGKHKTGVGLTSRFISWHETHTGNILQICVDNLQTVVTLAVESLVISTGLVLVGLARRVGAIGFISVFRGAIFGCRKRFVLNFVGLQVNCSSLTSPTLSNQQQLQL